jgi:glycosyltransferase involved in cell wall biosynthesis
MKKGLLVVSHFTKNRGTTDYFLEHLRKNGTIYYYLRHPFNFTKLRYSELIYFNGVEEEIKLRMKKAKNIILDLIRNYIFSFYVSLLLSFRVNKILCFGSFNVLPFLKFKRTLKREVYFWGVDYSTKRFNNKILNCLFLRVETKACKKSDLVINSSQRQKEARVKNHYLNNDKSLVVPNGINRTVFNKDFSRYSISETTS